MEIKTEIKKWDLIKLESFCTAKETINEMKRPCSEWQKIFAKLATDKGLISKVYKQLMQLNIKKKKKPNQKMDIKSKQTFLQRRHTDGLKAHEKMFTLLIIREMQIKTRVRYDFISVRRAIIKNSADNKWQRGHGGKGTLSTLLVGM